MLLAKIWWWVTADTMISHSTQSRISARRRRLIGATDPGPVFGKPKRLPGYSGVSSVTAADRAAVGDRRLLRCSDTGLRYPVCVPGRTAAPHTADVLHA